MEGEEEEAGFKGPMGEEREGGAGVESKER